MEPNNKKQKIDDEKIIKLLSQRRQYEQLIFYIGTTKNFVQNLLDETNNEIKKTCVHEWIIDNRFCDEKVMYCEICGSRK